MSFYSTTTYDPITCIFTLKFHWDPDLLDPERLLRLGCRVKKRPGCCVLCAANNDCARLPMHVRCHCVPEPYFMAEEEEYNP